MKRSLVTYAAVEISETPSTLEFVDGLSMILMSYVSVIALTVYDETILSVANSHYVAAISGSVIPVALALANGSDSFFSQSAFMIHLAHVVGTILVATGAKKLPLMFGCPALMATHAHVVSGQTLMPGPACFACCPPIAAAWVYPSEENLMQHTIGYMAFIAVFLYGFRGRTLKLQQAQQQ